MLRYTAQCLNNLKPVQSSLLASKLDVFTQPSRNTFVLKRKYPIPLHKKNQLPKPIKGKYMIYDMVQSPYSKKRDPVLIKLTEDVPAYGTKGTILEMNPDKAYEQLLLPKLAVYPTDQEAEEFRNQPADIVGIYSLAYLRKELAVMDLSVLMSATQPWTLEKWHVSVSFRKCGIQVPEDAITLPEKPISGPNMDINRKVFLVTLRLSDGTDLKVKCRIQHIKASDLLSSDKINKKKQVPDYIATCEALFPEEQEEIDKLPMHRLVYRELQNKAAV